MEDVFHNYTYLSSFYEGTHDEFPLSSLSTEFVIVTGKTIK